MESSPSAQCRLTSFSFSPPWTTLGRVLYSMRVKGTLDPSSCLADHLQPLIRHAPELEAIPQCRMQPGGIVGEPRRNGAPDMRFFGRSMRRPVSTTEQVRNRQSCRDAVHKRVSVGLEGFGNVVRHWFLNPILHLALIIPPS